LSHKLDTTSRLRSVSHREINAEISASTASPVRLLHITRAQDPRKSKCLATIYDQMTHHTASYDHFLRNAQQDCRLPRGKFVRDGENGGSDAYPPATPRDLSRSRLLVPELQLRGATDEISGEHSKRSSRFSVMRRSNNLTRGSRRSWRVKEPKTKHAACS